MTELVIGGVSGAELRQYIERIETLEHEKAELSEQIRDRILNNGMFSICFMLD